MEVENSTKRRDFLIGLEAQAQSSWSELSLYEADPQLGKDKYFVTFPYPYMNGPLHLGHAFSASKCEFMVRYQRMLGKNTCWPFAFHCTGMSIAASADRLQRELTDTTLPQRQTTTLLNLGVPLDQITQFAVGNHWLTYFPLQAKTDLQHLGMAIDWRRSFITTKINPYYDSFIRWQFEVLRAQQRLDIMKRHTIYSPKDNSPCQDFDRSIGASVVPQDYTLIKLKVLELSGPLSVLEGRHTFLVAATLRPETMYGQTNCFVLPEGDYGAYLMKNEEVFICSERSIHNMAWQNLTPEHGTYTKLATLKGTDLIKLPLKAPLSVYDIVYCLPSMTIRMDKGTGVVTSVPSDSPDDYVTLRKLKRKPAFREKFGITEEMVAFEPVPIISIPELGDLAAVKVSEDLQIKTPKDTALLAEAKGKVNLKGLYEGTMIVGAYAETKVSEAKAKVRLDLIRSGEALEYWEPAELVVSRSGQECVVSRSDQWYLKYGEAEWRDAVKQHLHTNFNAFSSPVFKELVDALDWLSEWACTHSYGFGTQLPWDQQYVIEPLSDSTVYMAFYTVSHFLQGEIDGNVIGPSGIRADQLTNEVWDFIFARSADFPETDIARETLERMRQEFLYWYPMDLRCSGKDLIRNHLTMSLYNHAAIWDSKPDLWPRSFFCNGYVLLNTMKMSKANGNFLTVKDCVEKFGADATRMALADAGDTLDDANFNVQTADNAVLWLTSLIEHYRQDLEQSVREGEKHIFDLIFENELNSHILETQQAYEQMAYRQALKHAFFDLVNLKEEYSIQVGQFHSELLMKYLEVQALLLAPIVPHVSEHLWSLVQQKMGQVQSTVVTQRFPVPSAAVDPILRRKHIYLKRALHAARIALSRGKMKTVPTKLVIYVAESFPPLQAHILDLLHGIIAEHNSTDSKLLLAKLKENDSISPKDKQKCLQFASFVVKDLRDRGIEALDRVSAFSELELLSQAHGYIRQTLKLEEITLLESHTASPADPTGIRESALPGYPQFFFNS
jgi:leucyl-tRNA synthetase